MSWINSFEASRTKNDLVGFELSLTGVAPEPLKSGLFTVIVIAQDLGLNKEWNDSVKKNGHYAVIMTRKDISTLVDANTMLFTFEPDPKNPQWANVLPLGGE